ncbi:MAG: NUDIX hydrolase, partial [Pseudomonadota bacterium]
MADTRAPLNPSSQPPLRPKDAATLIIIDTASSIPRILMGRRRPDLTFMPNKYVFPGGRCEKSDRTPPAATELHEADQKKLLVDMKGAPSLARARALAMAAIRETYEETGVLVGERSTSVGAPVISPPEQTSQVTAIATDGSGNPAPWSAYYGYGVLPKLDTLRFFARAITPPGRPRRFDTRFFFTTTDGIADQVPPPDEELQDIDWHDLETVRNLDIPNITRAVVEDLTDLIGSGLDQAQ